jgi:hypothetical protein
VRPPKGVPRDEWLLAIGLANHRPGQWLQWGNVLAFSVGFGAAFDAARSGWLDAKGVATHALSAGDHGDRQAYAAGAALAMALEES